MLNTAHKQFVFFLMCMIIDELKCLVMRHLFGRSLRCQLFLARRSIKAVPFKFSDLLESFAHYSFSVTG